MEFSYDDLMKIRSVFVSAGQWGPTTAYRYWYNVPGTVELDTLKVEDFACAFMTQYNRYFPNSY